MSENEEELLHIIHGFKEEGIFDISYHTKGNFYILLNLRYWGHYYRIKNPYLCIKYHKFKINIIGSTLFIALSIKKEEYLEGFNIFMEEGFREIALKTNKFNFWLRSNNTVSEIVKKLKKGESLGR